MSVTEIEPQGQPRIERQRPRREGLVISYAQAQMSDVIGGRGAASDVLNSSGRRSPVDREVLPLTNPLTPSEIDFGGIRRVSLSPANPTGTTLQPERTYAVVGTVTKNQDGTVSLQTPDDPTGINPTHAINLGTLADSRTKMPRVLAGVVRVTSNNDGQIEGRMLPDVLVPRANLSPKLVRKLPEGAVVVVTGTVDAIKGSRKGSKVKVYVGGDGPDRRTVTMQDARVTSSEDHSAAVGDPVQEADAVTITGVVRRRRGFFGRKRVTVEAVEMQLDMPAPQRVIGDWLNKESLFTYPIEDKRRKPEKHEGTRIFTQEKPSEVVLSEHVQLERLREQVMVGDDLAATMSQLSAFLPDLVHEGNHFAAGEVIRMLHAVITRHSKEVNKADVNTSPAVVSHRLLRGQRGQPSSSEGLDHLINQGVTALRGIVDKNQAVAVSLPLWTEQFERWVEAYPQLESNADWNNIIRQFPNQPTGRHAASDERVLVAA